MYKSLRPHAVCGLVLATLVILIGTPSKADHLPYLNGDVFAGIGHGLIKHFNSSGVLLEILDNGTGTNEDTGMAFDSAGNLYATNFSDSSVSLFNDQGGLVEARFLSGLNSHGESIVFDINGNFYIGHADGTQDILKFDPNGNPVATYDVATERRGSDWIDLAADQCTMFYTSEGFLIKRFDVCSNVQLSDFANIGSSPSFGLRIRDNGEVLVASSNQVVRFAVLLKFNAGIQVSLAGLTIFGEKTVALDDTDGDGLPDIWEENGFDYDGDDTPDVDLPGMGALKDHKDIFVYIDWLGEGFLGHDHKPDQKSIDAVVDAFAAAPVDCDEMGQNCKGINLHVVYGNEIDETDENRELGSVSGPDPACDYTWGEFAILKEDNFPPKMWPIFHYAIFGHELPIIPCIDGRPGGVSRNDDDESGTALFYQGSSDFVIGLGAWELFFGLELNTASTTSTAGTFMHELGHNLGLGHGGVVLDVNGNAIGSEHTLYKPNHLSVMNYSFSHRGLKLKDDSKGYMDYSRFSTTDLPDLDETNLSEADGINAGDKVKDYATMYFCQDAVDPEEGVWVQGLQQSIDWNCDGETTNDVSTNINKDESDSEENILSTLTTVNEWKHLNYKGGAIGAFGPTVVLPQVTSMKKSPEITFEQDLAIGPFVDNLPPQSNAGPDQAVHLGNIVNLIGSGNDPDSGPSPLTYSWVQTDGPAVLLTGATSATSTFTPTVVGKYTFTLTVSDGESSASDSISIDVIYDFNGFFSPVNNAGEWNIVKSGRAIPVKFSLNSDQGMAIFQTNSPNTRTVACDRTRSSDVFEETVTAGSSGLKYNPKKGTYNYIWKTKKAWAGTCKELVVTLIDGTTHNAFFNFTK